jgi:hypothetical protein
MGSSNQVIPPPPPGFKLESAIPPPPPGFKLEGVVQPETQGVEFAPIASLKTGVGQLAATVGGALQHFTGGTVGTGLQAAGEEVERQFPSSKVEQIRNTGDFLAWALNQTATQVPQLGLTTAAGVAGGLLGGPPGALVGAGLTSYIQNLGESYLQAKEAGANHEQAVMMSGVAGPMKAAFDLLEPVAVAGKIVFKPAAQAATRTALKSVVTGAAKGFATEGATEAAQEAIDITGETPFRGKIDPQALSRMLNAFMAGAVVGGIAGSVADVAESVRARKETPPVELEPDEVVKPYVSPKQQKVEAIAPEPKIEAVKPAPKIETEQPVPATIPPPQMELPLAEVVSAPPITPQPSQFITPDTKTDIEENGDTLWEALPDAPKVADKYPVIDEAGLFSATENDAIQSSSAAKGFLDLSHTALRKLLVLAQKAVGGAVPTELELALQYSGRPEVVVTPGSGDKWMFSVNPFSYNGENFAERVWGQLVAEVNYALSGDAEAYNANFDKVELAALPLKEAFISRLQKVSGINELIQGTIPAIQVREQSLVGKSPFFLGIKFDVSNQEGGPNAVSRAQQADAAVRETQVVAVAPRLADGSRVYGVSNLADPIHVENIVSALNSQPKVSNFLTALQNIVEAVKPIASNLNPQLADFFSGESFAGVMLNVRAIPGVVTWGRFVPTTRDLHEWSIAINPWGHMQANPDGSPTTVEEAAYHTVETVLHELAHAAVIGHGAAHSDLLAQLMKNFDPAPFIPTLMEIYADPSNANQFDPGFHGLLNQITPKPASAVVPASKGPGGKGQPTRKRRARTRITEPEPSLGTEPEESAAGELSRAGEGRAGEDLEDAAWGYGEDTANAFDTGPFEPAIVPDGYADTTNLDEIGQQLLDSAKKLKLPQQAQNDIVRYNKFRRIALTLIQHAQQNPNILPLQNFLQATREYWISKTKISMPGDIELREWLSLKKNQQRIISELLLQVHEESKKLKRLLNPNEISVIAQRLGATQDHIGMRERIEKTLRDTLNLMEQGQKDEVTRLWGLGSPHPDPIMEQARHNEITKEFSLMRRTNYFPESRFGRYAITVTSTQKVKYSGRNFAPGRPLHFETWESESDAKQAYKDLEAQFKGMPVNIKSGWLFEEHAAYFGFPPSLYRTLNAKVGLSPQQQGVLKDLFFARSPGRGFVKHLRRRRGVSGFSRDAQRAYADYMMHASNHLARLQNRWKLDAAMQEMGQLIKIQPTNAIKMGQLQDWMYRSYSALMNPTGDLGVLRGLTFSWFFWNVPKQAAVNLLQIPMFTYSYLAKRHEDAATTRELVRATRDLTRIFRSKSGQSVLSPSETQLLARAQEEGVTNQSYATETAAVAEGGIMSRFTPSMLRRWAGTDVDYTIRKWIDHGTWIFSQVEQYNRRVTFLSAIRLAQQQGLDTEQQYLAGRTAVETTQFEYARWNRPEIMRGKKAAIFIFKTYMQHAYYFAATGQGGWRFWAILLAIGGIGGVPLADDAMELLSLVLTKIKEWTGSKNPKVDIETEARELIAKVGANPNLFFDGLSKYSMGLTMLNWIGVPFPNLDLSSSIQLGKAIPGITPISKGLQGSMDPKEATLRVLTELMGAIGTTTMNMTQGVFGGSIDDVRTLRTLTPAAIRNVIDAGRMLSQQGYTDRRGAKLVSVDTRTTIGKAEVLGRALGFPLTKLNERYERDAAIHDIRNYYTTRREMILMDYSAAVGSKDREAVADARRSLMDYNKTAPREFRITGGNVAESVRTRAKNRRLVEMGLPEQRRYRELYKETEKAYPVGP